MVEVLRPQQKRSFLQSIVGGLASGTEDTIRQYQAQQQEARAAQQKQKSELQNAMALQQQKYDLKGNLDKQMLARKTKFS